MACVATARLAGYHIFVQHHSFSAIDRASYLMRLFVLFCGPMVRHVFLCGLMRQRFIERYPRTRRPLTSSNARYMPPQSSRAKSQSSVIKVGLLSTLGKDKGLYQYLDLLAACRHKGLPVVGLLAGPAKSSTDESRIAEAQRGLGQGLKYFGSLYGADQAQFYSEIDVFVFPTTYVNEAQPNVLFEAMSYGAAIISNVRGCISEDVTTDCGLLVRNHEDFVISAVAQLEHWCRFPEQLKQARTASAARLATLHEVATADYARMLSQIAGTCFESRKGPG
jgi:glycosyltransferase involved in cell wall biosynthesis